MRRRHRRQRGAARRDPLRDVDLAGLRGKQRRARHAPRQLTEVTEETVLHRETEETEIREEASAKGIGSTGRPAIQADNRSRLGSRTRTRLPFSNHYQVVLASAIRSTACVASRRPSNLCVPLCLLSSSVLIPLALSPPLPTEHASSCARRRSSDRYP